MSRKTAIKQKVSASALKADMPTAMLIGAGDGSLAYLQARWDCTCVGTISSPINRSDPAMAADHAVGGPGRSFKASLAAVSRLSYLRRPLQKRLSSQSTSIEQEAFDAPALAVHSFDETFLAIESDFLKSGHGINPNDFPHLAGWHRIVARHRLGAGVVNHRLEAGENVCRHAPKLQPA